MSVPKAVVFDVGGVLSSDPFTAFDDYGERFGIPRSTLSRCLIDDVEFAMVETGRGTSHDFFAALPERMLADHGLTVTADELIAILASGRAFRAKMIELATELSRCHRVAVLTNNVAENQDYLLAHLAPPVFEFVVNSSDVGLRKPQPEIYREVLRRLDIPAADIVFVDDLPQNLSPPSELGMRTVLFESEPQCRSALRQLGAQCATRAP